MKRTFSVIRRRPNLVDAVLPLIPGTQIYRLKWAANFDAVFTQFLDATNVGFRDPSIDPMVVESQPTSGRQVRVVFDPATYGIPDTLPFWLQLWTVPFGGAEAQQSAAGLILSDGGRRRTTVVKGSAPNAADVSGSLQLDLPGALYEAEIRNASLATSLFVATEEGGAEMEIIDSFKTYCIPQGSLWVRGGGGSVDFSTTFSLVPRVNQ